LVIVSTQKLILINIIYPISWISYWSISLAISFINKKSQI
jgi:hypothetical protein